MVSCISKFGWLGMMHRGGGRALQREGKAKEGFIGENRHEEGLNLKLAREWKVVLVKTTVVFALKIGAKWFCPYRTRYHILFSMFPP